ncbi:MAG: hypothetical protein ACE14P_06940 [Methanotrichaceae archaeon]
MRSEPFDGRVPSIERTAITNMNAQLAKCIKRLDELPLIKANTDAMLDKQDQMLDKQDITIGVLKETKEDTSSIKNGITELKKDAIDTILEKYFELSREIAEIKAKAS